MSYTICVNYLRKFKFHIKCSLPIFSPIKQAEIDRLVTSIADPLAPSMIAIANTSYFVVSLLLHPNNTYIAPTKE